MLITYVKLGWSCISNKIKVVKYLLNFDRFCHVWFNWIMSLWACKSVCYNASPKPGACKFKVVIGSCLTYLFLWPTVGYYVFQSVLSVHASVFLFAFLLEVFCQGNFWWTWWSWSPINLKIEYGDNYSQEGRGGGVFLCPTYDSRGALCFLVCRSFRPSICSLVPPSVRPASG